MELVFNAPSQIIRSVTDNTVRGTAIVYYNSTPETQCQPYGNDTYERIMPGACESISRSKRSIIATYDHKELLGRTPGTLSLTATPHGLDFCLNLPNTSRGRDVKELIERGDITGCSFTAKPGYSTISNEQGKRIVNIRSLDISEIALVVNPYYTATSIARSKDWHDELEREQERWNKTRALIDRIKSI